MDGVRSFGYSLSGGMDMDGNGYPDLLVGAYESDTVALIRSRSIIRLHPNVTGDPLQIDLESTPQCDFKDVKPQYKNRRCIKVELCLTYTIKPENR